MLLLGLALIAFNRLTRRWDTRGLGTTAARDQLAPYVYGPRIRSVDGRIGNLGSVSPDVGYYRERVVYDYEHAGNRVDWSLVDVYAFGRQSLSSVVDYDRYVGGGYGQSS
jgi:hypothetical protein